MTEPSRRERIQAKAYEIWVGEGMPEGRDLANWVLAEQIVDQEDLETEEPAGDDS